MLFGVMKEDEGDEATGLRLTLVEIHRLMGMQIRPWEGDAATLFRIVDQAPTSRVDTIINGRGLPIARGKGAFRGDDASLVDLRMIARHGGNARIDVLRMELVEVPLPCFAARSV